MDAWVTDMGGPGRIAGGIYVCPHAKDNQMHPVVLRTKTPRPADSYAACPARTHEQWPACEGRANCSAGRWAGPNDAAATFFLAERLLSYKNWNPPA